MNDENDESDDRDAIARRITRPVPGREQPRPMSGEFRGVSWGVTVDGDDVRMTIGGRRIHLTPDGIGSFVTHEMVGRWRDLAELARTILKYHPDYSPLARRDRTT